MSGGKKSSHPGVVEQVRTGVNKGVKNISCGPFSFFQKDIWRGKGRPVMD